jgi:hypothetical protein
MNRLDHDAVVELLGAYALDAVERDEAEAVEAHLEHCAQCSAELAGYREVAGLVANSGGDAPEHLWRSIVAQIDVPEHEEPPPVAHLLARRSAAARAPRTATRRWTVRPWVSGVAAAAILIVAVLGVQVGRLSHRVNELQATSAQGALEQAATNALADSQARHIVLDTANSTGPPVAEIAVLPSGSAFLVNRGLPQLTTAQTYQLWAQIGDQLVSLGLLGNAPHDVAFHVDPSVAVTSFAVTAEHAGGVVRTAHVPVAASPTSA